MIRGLSGIKATFVGAENTGQGGFWLSHDGYGPDDKDWWRSSCGHTVNANMGKCPVCGEANPGPGVDLRK